MIPPSLKIETIKNYPSFFCIEPYISTADLIFSQLSKKSIWIFMSSLHFYISVY